MPMALGMAGLVCFRHKCHVEFANEVTEMPTVDAAAEANVETDKVGEAGGEVEYRESVS
jgi:hypothetical protein